MSQQSIERIVGRLMTDEAFRARFGTERAALIAELVASGLELNRCELAALSALDQVELARCAEALDPRLQKCDLRLGAAKADDSPERGSR